MIQYTPNIKSLQSFAIISILPYIYFFIIKVTTEPSPFPDTISTFKINYIARPTPLYLNLHIPSLTSLLIPAFHG